MIAITMSSRSPRRSTSAAAASGSLELTVMQPRNCGCGVSQCSMVQSLKAAITALAYSGLGWTFQPYMSPVRTARSMWFSTMSCRMVNSGSEAGRPPSGVTLSRRLRPAPSPRPPTIELASRIFERHGSCR